MRVVVSGGGTAGHISPILATVDALKSRDKTAEILYIGQREGVEAKIAHGAGLEFAGISAGKFRRVQNPRYQYQFNLQDAALNVRDTFRIAAGLAQSLKILRDYKPDVVFLSGGFVGFPVGTAARLLGIPYMIHILDATPGLTHRLLAKHAATIATGFPVNKYRDLNREVMVYTGNPVRRMILKAHRLEGVAYFKLEEDVPVVLVMGGSQGARSVNEALIGALRDLTRDCQVIHVTGEGEIERVKFAVKRMGLARSERYHAHAFLQAQMGPALAAADLVVSRAGANTIAELAALRKPTILIPNNMMAGHQVHNAVMLARQGAVRMLPEEKLTPRSLAREIARILESDEEQAYLAKKIGEYAVADADQRLAEAIMETARSPEAEPAAVDGGGE